LKNSRLSLIYLTILFNVIFQLVNFSYKFVTTPFLLHLWGDIKFGEWLVIFSFISSITLLNFGIAKFYGNNLRRSYIENNFNKYKEQFSEIIFVIIILFIIFGSILYYLCFTFNMNTVLSVNNWETNEVSLSLFFLGLSILSMIKLEVVSYLFVSIGKYSIQPLISSLNLSLQLILIITLSYFEVGIVAISFVIFLSVFLISTSSFIYFIMKNKIIIPTSFSLNFTGLFENIKSSIYFQFITLSQFITLQGSVIIINNSLGALTVSIFVLTRTITSGLGRQIIQIINHSIWPECTTLFAENNFYRLRILHSLMSKLSIIISTLFIIFIIVFIIDIFQLWLSDNKFFNKNIIVLLLIYLITIYTWIPSSLILMSNNNIKKFSILSLVSSISFIIFSYLFLNVINIEGLILFMITFDCIFLTYFIPKEACKSICQNQSEFYINLFILLIPSIIILTLFNFDLLGLNTNTTYTHKLILYISLSLLSIAYFIKSSLTKFEKLYILKILNKTLRKIKNEKK